MVPAGEGMKRRLYVSGEVWNNQVTGKGKGRERVVFKAGMTVEVEIYKKWFVKKGVAKTAIQ